MKALVGWGAATLLFMAFALVPWQGWNQALQVVNVAILAACTTFAFQDWTEEGR